ncbi:hypothetical protein VDG37_20270, partial [Xanthomonas campestris pv. raphani]|uniref:hypothetical protein n=1 Tax=Xanthomonas campestris TaxID=339 RepID=UPI002B239BE1
LAPGLLALAQALSVTERQLHGSLLNIRRVVSRICRALFRGSLDSTYLHHRIGYLRCWVSTATHLHARIGLGTCGTQRPSKPPSTKTPALAGFFV